MSWLDKIKGKIMAYTIGQANEQDYAFGWGSAQQAVDLQNAKMQSQLAMQQAQMQNALAQSMVNTKNAISGSILNNAFNGYQPTPQAAPLSAYNLNANSLYSFDELNDEGSVYNMPLQTAVDLAINMFGSGWFKDEATTKVLEENTDFLIKVMSKLYKAGRLKCETCHKVDTMEMITAWKILDTDHAD